ncbi:hypothetical protein mflW37_0250 [Mesoplasma florum W37]|uniref:DUF1904 domain-containing protein n=1 Tax=Mesoplasma florum TaxID=2151 RepID=A0AAD0HSV6_MESFO|nr:DUF1904 family protein [Mesoplasma florum]AGY41092.1 hypothetical protein mflW37_0250 [Mesoplasma florum W37]AVN59325.1 DUF1904 domain-containing protein [Mesoplasma florum]AVN60706.1 DUF1904 domain-containing protein [Mesoplasma florum]AVN65430.1 hypothetical protein MflW12_0250 [Mesoplasma florum]
MPILKFNGTTEKQVKQYSKKINELVDLIVAKPESILMMNNNNNIYVSKNTNKRIYVEVDWLIRPEEARIALVKHLTDFFGGEGITVSVKFTEINKNLYVNNNRMG